MNSAPGPPPKPRDLNAWRASRLHWGCSVLDRAMGGGFRAGIVTEFVGEATAGKSQLCVQLMLHCQLPVERGGLNGRAIYVYTEGRPATKRIDQMCARFQAREQLGWDSRERISVRKDVGSPAELLACLRSVAAEVAREGGTASKQPRVRLVVVDSIANVFRDSELDPMAQGADDVDGPGLGAVMGAARAAQMFEVACVLKAMASRHEVVVVTTNQVTDVLGDFADASQAAVFGPLVTSGRRVLPALGLAWANCVNHRVFLSRATSVGAEGNLGGAVARRMQVLLSPYLPARSCPFVIDDDGLHGCAEPQQ